MNSYDGAQHLIGLPGQHEQVQHQQPRRCLVSNCTAVVRTPEELSIHLLKAHPGFNVGGQALAMSGAKIPAAALSGMVAGASQQQFQQQQQQQQHHHQQQQYNTRFEPPRRVSGVSKEALAMKQLQLFQQQQQQQQRLQHRQSHQFDGVSARVAHNAIAGELNMRFDYNSQRFVPALGGGTKSSYFPGQPLVPASWLPTESKSEASQTWPPTSTALLSVQNLAAPHRTPTRRTTAASGMRRG